MFRGAPRGACFARNLQDYTTALRVPSVAQGLVRRCPACVTHPACMRTPVFCRFHFLFASPRIVSSSFATPAFAPASSATELSAEPGTRVAQRAASEGRVGEAGWQRSGNAGLSRVLAKFRRPPPLSVARSFSCAARSLSFRGCACRLICSLPKSRRSAASGLFTPFSALCVRDPKRPRERRRRP